MVELGEYLSVVMTELMFIAFCYILYLILHVTL